MRRLLSPAVLLLLATLALPIQAKESPAVVGQDYDTVRVDLDNDGQPETVGLRCTKVTESGWWGRLTVWSRSKVIWQSPPAERGVWAFGAWDWGVSRLELIDDIDNDGNIEVLSPEPISDLRPTPFRTFKWTGKEFQPTQTLCLLRQTADFFAWSPQKTGRNWVSKFEPGQIGTVFQIDKKAGYKTSRAILKARQDGFRVVKWLE